MQRDPSTFNFYGGGACINYPQPGGGPPLMALLMTPPRARAAPPRVVFACMTPHRGVEILYY